MAWRVISAHNRSGDPERLCLHFDSMTSHDITYVGIIQTARASGMTAFPLPYVLTNCHNSLCAVGGTINEDDHKFAPTATGASTFRPIWPTSTATTAKRWPAAGG